MERSPDLSPSDPSSGAGAATDLLASLRQASGRQARFLRRLIPPFLTECPELLSTMRQAIDAGDADKLHYAAHTLKGAASFLADGPITEAARQLETMDGARIPNDAGAALAFLDQALAEVLPALADFARQPEPGSSA
jgi:HPt (histidine-containing phosphotransfer) domain-containing protein